MQKQAKKPILSKVLQNFWVDILLTLAFIVDMNVRFTGLSLHEWIGVGLAIAILLHLLLHWEWMASIVKRFFKRVTFLQRFKTFLDILIFLDFILVSLSGIMISHYVLPAIGLQAEKGNFWRWLHFASADWSIFLIGLHLAINWNWIVDTTKKYLLEPVKLALKPKRELPGDLS